MYSIKDSKSKCHNGMSIHLGGEAFLVVGRYSTAEGWSVIIEWI